MLGWWEQVLNGLVYQLYFPDELKAKDLHIFDQFADSELPALDALPEAERLILLRQHFERTYEIEHALRATIHNLGSLELVRIIEGKE